jgi:hypothetical protein
MFTLFSKIVPSNEVTSPFMTPFADHVTAPAAPQRKHRRLASGDADIDRCDTSSSSWSCLSNGQCDSWTETTAIDFGTSSSGWYRWRGRVRNPFAYGIRGPPVVHLPPLRSHEDLITVTSRSVGTDSVIRKWTYRLAVTTLAPLPETRGFAMVTNAIGLVGTQVADARPQPHWPLARLT